MTDEPLTEDQKKHSDEGDDIRTHEVDVRCVSTPNSNRKAVKIYLNEPYGSDEFKNLFQDAISKIEAEKTTHLERNPYQESMTITAMKAVNAQKRDVIVDENRVTIIAYTSEIITEIVKGGAYKVFSSYGCRPPKRVGAGTFPTKLDSRKNIYSLLICRSFFKAKDIEVCVNSDKNVFDCVIMCDVGYNIVILY